VRKIAIARAAAIIWIGAMDRPRFMGVHEWLQRSLVESAVTAQTTFMRLDERARRACEAGQRKLAAVALGFGGARNISTQWAAKELGWRWTMRGVVENGLRVALDILEGGRGQEAKEAMESAKPAWEEKREKPIWTTAGRILEWINAEEEMERYKKEPNQRKNIGGKSGRTYSIKDWWKNISAETEGGRRSEEKRKEGRHGACRWWERRR
jgi:hypothetical protein